MQTPQSDSDRFGPPVELLPHLVLGCAKDSANLGMLRQLGVTAILNISHNCPNHFGSLFDYMEIPVEDSYQADLLSYLHAAFRFIGEFTLQQHTRMQLGPEQLTETVMISAQS